MVFPRRGCVTCKTRRIKCDSVHPVCGRCQKASRACEWDQNEEAGWLFKNENAFAQGKPRRPWKPKPQVSRPESEEDLTVLLISSSVATEEIALRFWFDNYVFKNDEIPEFAQDYRCLLTPYRDTAQHSLYLRTVISAFSHVVFGRVMQSDESLEEAERLFTQSIMSMQSEIRQLSQSNIDELLLVTMLMADCEVRSGNPKPLTNRGLIYPYYKNIMNRGWNHHEQDEAALLELDVTGSKIWKNNHYYDEAMDLLRKRQKSSWTPNISLDRVVRRRLIQVCILRGISVPEWLQDGAQFGEEGLILALDSIMVRVAALRERSLCLFLPKSARFSSQPRPGDIAAEARVLDAALESWSATLPEDWKFTLLSVFAPDFTLDGIIHVYATHGHAAVWCRYHAIRLVVNSICRRALFVMAQCSSQMLSVVPEQDECLRKMASLGADFCRSVPAVLSPTSTEGYSTTPQQSEINDNPSHSNQGVMPKLAILLAWPLILAVNTDGIPETQKEWLEDKLKLVVCALGDATLETVLKQNELKF
ncbi:hypothetical protein F5Y11DRAFT_100881 [Daldinia sp. FL1419]|nr:hypothetical protein F5Y11DRAFT_100881 [Daldinia sp. FL1419]